MIRLSLLHSENERLRGRIAKLKAILQQHHQWHLDFAAVECIEDGATFTLDLADAYSDSNLCQDTLEALDSK